MSNKNQSCRRSRRSSLEEWTVQMSQIVTTGGRHDLNICLFSHCCERSRAGPSLGVECRIGAKARRRIAILGPFLICQAPQLQPFALFKQSPMVINWLRATELSDRTGRAWSRRPGTFPPSTSRPMNLHRVASWQISAISLAIAILQNISRPRSYTIGLF